MLFNSSSKKAQILLVLVCLGVNFVRADDSQNEFCCTENGVEYQCSPGTSCCSCSECCTSSEFCISSLGICVQYVLSVISPLALLLFLGTCFFNYKSKRAYLVDLESLKKLEDENNDILNSENKSAQNNKLNDENSEGTTQRKVEDQIYTQEFEKSDQLKQNLLDQDSSKVIDATE